MDIKNLDTSRFAYNPKDPDFVQKLESMSDYFKVKIPKIPPKKYFTYLALLLDPASELRKTITTLHQRKVMAALTAGFTLNEENRFPKEVEDVLIGENLDAARMASEFCVLVGGTDLLVHATFSRIFVELMSGSTKDTTLKDRIANITNIKKQLDSLEEKIFGGVESAALRKSLYLSSKSISLGLQVEDIVERIINGEDLGDLNPFPNNYKPDPITYAGQTAPEEE